MDLTRHEEAVTLTQRWIVGVMCEKEGLRRFVDAIWTIMRSWTRLYIPSHIIMQRLLVHLLHDRFSLGFDLKKQPVIGKKEYVLTGKFQVYTHRDPRNWDFQYNARLSDHQKECLSKIEFDWSSVLSDAQQEILMKLAYGYKMFTCRQEPMGVRCRRFELSENAKIQDELTKARYNVVQVFVNHVLAAAILSKNPEVLLSTHTSLVDSIQKITAPGNMLQTDVYNQFMDLRQLVQNNVNSRKIIELQMEIMRLEPGSPLNVSLRDSWTDSDESCDDPASMSRSYSGTLDMDMPQWRSPRSHDSL